MALAAAGLTGVTAGVVILVALAAFALARSLTSIAAKDVLGRTVPKDQRGQITGLATVTAGVVAYTDDPAQPIHQRAPMAKRRLHWTTVDAGDRQFPVQLIEPD